MIPRRLQIKNFLSYGIECPPIIFEGHSLICLSGNNGHGKSALLDAITWAVWGAARKIQNSVRADHGLLKLGQSTMMVIFDYTVHDVSYRIKREFDITYGKPKITLDIGIIDDDGSIHSLTEKTVRDTQNRIEQIIGLDYETFVNSSFLRQGNANEFSKRSPKERKEIISTILGLGIYDALKKAALEKSKEAQQQAMTINVLLTHAQQEKEILSATVQEYTSLHAHEQHIMQEYTVKKNQLADIQQSIAQQESLRALYRNTIQEYTIKKANHTEKKEILKKLVAEWRRLRTLVFDYALYNTVKNNLSEKEKQYIQVQKECTIYITLKEQLQMYDKKHASAIHLLTQKQLQAEAEQTIIIERLENGITILQEHIKNLTAHHVQEKEAYAEIQKKKEQLQLLQTEIAHHQLTMVTVQKQFEKRKEAYHRWTTLGNIIRDEHGTQLQRLQLATDHTNPSCPLCEQSLSAARKRFLHTKIGDTLSTQAHRLARLKKIIPTLKQILVENHASLQLTNQKNSELHTREHTLSLEMQKESSVIQSVATLDAQLKQAHTKQQMMLEQKKALVPLKVKDIKTPEIINLEQEISTYKEIMHELNSKLAAIRYNPQTIISLHAELEQLQKEIATLEQNKQNCMLQEERKKNIYSLCTELKKEKKELVQQEQSELILASSATTVQHLYITLDTTAQELKKLDTAREELLIQQGKCHAAQSSLDTLEKTIQQQTAALATYESIITDYNAITAAVGKDGVQALLIEEAIPEIEETANNLLAKLSHNNAHIVIESMRDLKNGGTKETLDIKISDAQGIRPYEMFSGGEAFRIDFALRIAISKLLAHRAGTALQTLIIDEGFGSQDEEGLAVLTDLLHALKDEFAKIIVVSHLPTLKDQFPVHFHVEKGSHGSIVHVIEQG